MNYRVRPVPYLQTGQPPYGGPPDDDGTDGEATDSDVPGQQDQMEQDVQEADTPPIGVIFDRYGGQAPVVQPGYLDMSGGPAYMPQAGPPVVEPPTAPEGDKGSAGVPNRAIAPANMPDTGSYIDILNKQKTLASTMPVRTPPKWWQRGLAAGLGAAEGWSNAASRTRTPFNIQQSGDNILYPGYEQKMAQYQSKMAPLEAQAKIESEKIGAQYGGLKAQSEAQLKAAQAEAALKHGDYWAGRSQMERNQWKIDKNGNLYNQVTGQMVTKAQTPADRYKDALALMSPDSHPLTPAELDDARYYAFNGKFPNVTRSANKTEWQSYLDAAGGDSKRALALKQQDEIARAKAVRDPLTQSLAEERLQKLKNDELDKVGQTKLTGERQLLAGRATELGKLENATAYPQFQNGQNAAGKAAAQAEINNRYRSQLQNVQDSFARQARERGVQTDDYDVKINPSGRWYDYTPRATQSVSPPPGKPVTGSAPPAAPPAQGARPTATRPATPAAPPPPPPATSAPSGPVQVKIPTPDGQGKVLYFPNQAALDAYSAETGLKFSSTKQ